MASPQVRDIDPGPVAGSRVLVTGGAGFIGSHLVDALAEVADVHVLDTLESGRATAVHGDATLRVGDVSDDDVLLETFPQGVDYVFHLAAVSSVPDAMADPPRTVEVNVRATASLLERAAETGARLLFASSAAVYGEPSSTPVAESDPMTPRNPYGASKLAADQLVRGYEDWFDVETVALRLFNVYGPGQVDGVVPEFLDRIRRGDPLVVHGDGEQTRDFVHVDDVVRAMITAAGTDATGEAHNVGTGEETSVRELAERMRVATDADVDIVHEDPRPADIRRSMADTRKAHSELGFEASTTVEDGVRSLVDRIDAQ